MLPIVKTSEIVINENWCLITMTKNILLVNDEPDVNYIIRIF
jgi:hypothetical protein